MSTETAFEKDGIRRLTQLAQFAQVGLGVEGGHLRCFESIRVDLTARQWRGVCSRAPEGTRDCSTGNLADSMATVGAHHRGYLARTRGSTSHSIARPYLKRLKSPDHSPFRCNKRLIRR